MEKELAVSQMFNEISPSYDRVNHLLSFGIDRRWRKELEKHLPKGKDLSLLDLATGTCDQLISLMQSGKIQKAIGVDLAEEMLNLGRKKIESRGFGNRVELLVANAQQLPFLENSFDCASISFGIRNVQDPLKGLCEMHRVLKPGGRALVLEFSLPKNPLIRFILLQYLRRILPNLGGVVSGKKSAYRYLNQTIEAFPYGEGFCDLMKEAGFGVVSYFPLTLGTATLYVGEKR